MPRKPKPYEYRGHYCTSVGGEQHQKLCPIEMGMKHAEVCLARLLVARHEAAMTGKQAPAPVVVQGSVLPPPGAPVSITQAIDAFLRFKQSEADARTFAWYRQCLRPLHDQLGHHKLGEVTVLHGVEYKEWLQKKKPWKRGQRTMRGLGPTATNHHLRAAKALLNWAFHEQDWGLKRNPWRKLKTVAERGRQRLVTDEEFRRLVAACAVDARGSRNTLKGGTDFAEILQVLRWSAMRPGEIRVLTWGMVHWEKDLLIIPAGKTKTRNTARQPQDRLIPLLPEGRALLQGRYQRAVGQGKASPVDPVFPPLPGPRGESPEEWVLNSLCQRFRRLRKRAGLDSRDADGEFLTLYCLRHTRLTEVAVVEGWAFPTVQKLAGHTTAQMTTRYMHADGSDLVRAALEGRKRRLGESVEG
jgi:integrase